MTHSSPRLPPDCFCLPRLGFLLRSSFSATRSVVIRTIRLFRSAPVISAHAGQHSPNRTHKSSNCCPTLLIIVSRRFEVLSRFSAAQRSARRVPRRYYLRPIIRTRVWPQSTQTAVPEVRRPCNTRVLHRQRKAEAICTTVAIRRQSTRWVV